MIDPEKSTEDDVVDGQFGEYNELQPNDYCVHQKMLGDTEVGSIPSFMLKGVQHHPYQVLVKCMFHKFKDFWKSV